MGEGSKILGVNSLTQTSNKPTNYVNQKWPAAPGRPPPLGYATGNSYRKLKGEVVNLGEKKCEFVNNIREVG